ncbi:MAG: TolC family protein, partial [Saprospiraceae bacterium]|nr:TolC family protein [Saprospiraceae bacterium]
ANVPWKEFFDDPYLVDLIDSALANNQELHILLAEMEMANSEVLEKTGEYMPFVGIGAATGVEKVGRYTSQGASDANTEIDEGREMPDPLPDFLVGAYASWELDVWKKLRNAKKAAALRYLSTIEGRNFMITHLVAEIAQSYFELLSLDNQLAIVQQNIKIQQNALEIVKLQKQAAKVTELAVIKFEAELLKNQSLQYDIRQNIIETENRINFLTGRLPGPVERNSEAFSEMYPDTIRTGLPSQLLTKRPDIKQAELELAASRLDVEVARASFLPQFSLTASFGAQAFTPGYLAKLPESLLFSLAGDMVAPLINKRGLQARFQISTARQKQAVYNYQQSILNAYREVTNQLAKMDNLGSKYATKEEQVKTLNRSVSISTSLFQSARADYMEVLLTQRDALEAKMELIETKLEQMNSMVHLYQALGGGWQ